MTVQSPLVQSRAEVATPKASRYLQQLCKHWQHKLTVAFDAQSGRVEFSIGECRMDAAPELLTLTLSAPDSEKLSELQEVVASHLQRFAFKDGLSVEWREAAAS